jgi:hypothetical protein
VKKIVALESKGMLHTRSRTFTWTQIMNWLEVDAQAHRRIYRDARQAYAMMAIFFPGLYESETASNFKDSPLVNQSERAKSVPIRRSYHSNKYRSKKFWNEWDEILKRNPRHDFKPTKYPAEWNCVIRPIIAHCKLIISFSSPLLTLEQCTRKVSYAIRTQTAPLVKLLLVKKTTSLIFTLTGVQR